MDKVQMIRAEIERYGTDAQIAYNPRDEYADFFYGKVVACEDLLSFINTLPDEPKTDDLETEIKRWVYEPFFDLDGIAIAGTSLYATVEDMEHIARHFYELGKNARKEE